MNKDLVKTKEQLLTEIDGLKTKITELEHRQNSSKQTEEVLKENEERYQKAQKLGKVGNWEYNIITAEFWVSDEVRRIYGFAPGTSHFSTENVESCIPDRDNVHRAMIDLIENDIDYNLQFDILTHDTGERKTIISKAQLEKDERGTPIKVTGVIQDVTKQKQAEQNLKKSEEKLVFLNRSICELIALNDKKQVFEYFINSIHSIYPKAIVLYVSVDETKENTTLESIAGLKSSILGKINKIAGRKFLGKQFKLTKEHLEIFRQARFHTYDGGLADFSANELPASASKIIQKLLNVHQIYTIGINRNNRLLGAMHIITLNGSEIADGEFLETYTAYFSSVVENLNYTAQLQETKELIKKTISTVPDIIIRTNLNGDIVFANEALVKQFPTLSNDNILERNILDFIVKKDLPRAMENTKLMFQHPLGIQEYQLQIVDGTIYDFAVNGDVLRDSNAQAIGMVYVLRNITEQKQIENSLKQSEVNLREAQRIARIGSWTLDLKTGKVEMSDEMLNILGLKDKEEASHELEHEKLYTPESWQRYKETLDTIIRKGKSIEVELEFSEKNSKFRYAISKAEPVFDDNNTVIFLKGTLQDITERKKAEHKIHQQNEFLNKVMESLTHPFYVINANSYKIEMANSASGYNLELGKNTCHKITHNSDKPCSGLEHPCPLEKIKRTKEPTMAEHIHFDSAGNKKYVEVYGYPIFDKKGDVTQIIEYSLDITERKLAEKKLKENEAMLMAAMENSQAGIAIAEVPSGKLRYVNKAGLLIRDKDYDVLVEDVDINKYVSSWQIMHLDGTAYKPEEVPLARAVLKGDIVKEEFIIRRDDQDDRAVLAHAAPINNDKGERIAAIVVFLDITKRKKIEDDLKQSLESEELISFISSSFVGTFNIDSSINELLKNIGKHCHAERSYIFKFNTNEETMDNTYEWCKKGVSPQIDNLKKLPNDSFPWWMSKLKNNESIYIENVGNLPPEATAEKEILISQNISSVIVLPLIVNETLYGFIGLDNVDNAKIQSTIIVKTLQVTSEILGNAVQRMQAEEEVSSSRKKLKIMNSILRHDITNDIVTMKSALSIYRRNKDEKMLDEIERRVKKSISTINKQGEQEDFINTHTHLEKYDMAEVARDVSRNHDDIVVNITGTGLVFADNAIYSVIDNIVGNAVKHGKASKLDITIAQIEDYCEIRLADNGIGIPEKIKKDIFDKGFRYGETGNTGIGLYIVKNTIENYGGTISVTKHKSNGAIFQISLRRVF